MAKSTVEELREAAERNAMLQADLFQAEDQHRKELDAQEEKYRSDLDHVTQKLLESRQQLRIAQYEADAAVAAARMAEDDANNLKKAMREAKNYTVWCAFIFVLIGVCEVFLWWCGLVHWTQPVGSALALIMILLCGGHYSDRV